MAIVKFITSGCPMNNIFPYVTRKEATEQRLISGIYCSPDTALEEFRYIKQKYGKEDGRSYYHIVQSFSPNDNLTPETAHEIGLKFAEYFPGFQILVATHCNTGNIHNHLIMNSVSFENGKKFHQSRDGLLQVKAYPISSVGNTVLALPKKNAAMANGRSGKRCCADMLCLR